MLGLILEWARETVDKTKGQLEERISTQTGHRQYTDKQPSDVEDTSASIFSSPVQVTQQWRVAIALPLLLVILLITLWKKLTPFCSHSQDVDQFVDAITEEGFNPSSMEVDKDSNRIKEREEQNDYI